MDNFIRAATAAVSGAKLPSTSTSTSPPASPPAWLGAPLPRGYSNITDAVETRGCDLLNADEGAGRASVLFDRTRPSALADAADTAATAATTSTTRDFVESGADDQLLMFMPFHSTVKLHSIQLTSLPPPPSTDPSAPPPPMRPATIKLFTNRPHSMDFGEADDTTPEQEINIPASRWNAAGTADVQLRFVKYQNITSLVLYVTRGEGEGETVRLDRVRLVGETGEKRGGKIEKIEHDH